MDPATDPPARCRETARDRIAGRKVPLFLLPAFFALAGLGGGCLPSLGGAGEPEKAQGKTLAIERDAESVRVLAGGALIARYRYGGPIRKPYLAELAAPGGQNILRDAPPDHLHHHGAMFACNVEGVDFWGEFEKGGREAHVTFEPLAVETVGTLEGAKREAAVLREKLRWVDADGRALLEEERTLKVLAPATATGSAGSPVQVVAWESRLSPPAGGKTVTLSGSPYHGLGLRFIQSMDRGGAFLSSSGATGVDGTNGKDAAWCAYSAETGPGSPVTVAIFDAPSNARHPVPWFTMTDSFAYLSDSQAIGAKPVALAVGQSFVLRAAIVVMTGKADGARVGRLFGEVTRDLGWEGKK